MQRRDALRTLLAVSLPGSLAACGGGGSGSPEQKPPAEDPGPQIASFTSDKVEYFIGEPAVFTAVFDKGSAQIFPDMLSIMSGVPVTVPFLNRTAFQLAVSSRSTTNPSAFLEAKRDLKVGLKYRNQWTSIEMGFARAAHVTVQGTNNHIYVIGGESGAPALAQEVMVFDPRTEKFTAGGTLLTGRTQHSATLLIGGNILIFGGGRSVSGTPAAELYDSVAAKSRATASQPKANRLYHTATRLDDGKILLLGGKAIGEVAFSATADLYDPATEQFTRLAAQLQYGRVSHTATRLANGKVLVAGGSGGTDAALPPELYDPTTQTFTTLAALPAEESQSRVYPTAVAGASGDVFLFGGENITDAMPFDRVLKFAKDTNAASVAGNLIVPRTAHAAVRMLDGRILVAGGVSGLVSTAQASTDLYSPADGASSAGPAMKAARMYHTADLLINGKVLVIGGNTSGLGVASTAELYS